MKSGGTSVEQDALLLHRALADQAFAQADASRRLAAPLCA